jgi:hypothetical protein
VDRDGTRANGTTWQANTRGHANKTAPGNWNWRSRTNGEGSGGANWQTLRNGSRKRDGNTVTTNRNARTTFNFDTFKKDLARAGKNFQARLNGKKPPPRASNKPGVGNKSGSKKRPAFARRSGKPVKIKAGKRK